LDQDANGFPRLIRPDTTLIGIADAGLQSRRELAQGAGAAGTAIGLSSLKLIERQQRAEQNQRETNGDEAARATIP
jgi:hypothetical protein